MIELKNEPLSNHTTFKMGGLVKTMLIPETEEELVSAVKECRQKSLPYRILGNGSNLIVSEKGLRRVIVIKNSRACMRLDGEGTNVYAGSTVKVQSFIRYCVNRGLEGFEYLYSVPATIGGAIFMNAGRGRHKNQQISDGLVHVRIFDGQSVREIPKAQCGFYYRGSIFHTERDWLILGAQFDLKTQPRVVGEQKIRERMEFIKAYQDHKAASAGSIFKKGHPWVFKWVQGLRCGGTCYSRKATNWLVNSGTSKLNEVKRLIFIVKVLNILLLSKAEVEVEIWSDD